MTVFLLQGIILGATAASQPGPFQAFLMVRTLQQGWRRTTPAAFAPLISDGPIIILMVLILSRTPEVLLNLLQLGGGAFLIYLAFRSFRSARTPAKMQNTGKTTLLHAAAMNLLNPNPYIFWASVSGPILIEGWRRSPAVGISFLAGFYGALIGGFFLVIVLFSLFGRFGERARFLMTVISSGVLAVFGVFLLFQGAYALFF